MLVAYCAPGIDGADAAAGLASALPEPDDWESPRRLVSGNLHFAESADRLVLPLCETAVRLHHGGLELELRTTSGVERAEGPFQPTGPTPNTLFVLRRTDRGSGIAAARPPGSTEEDEDESVVAKALLSYRDSDCCIFAPSLELIEVRKEWRGRGLARLMLEAVEAHVAAACRTALPWRPARLRADFICTALGRGFFKAMGYASGDGILDDENAERLLPRPASSACR